MGLLRSRGLPKKEGDKEIPRKGESLRSSKLSGYLTPHTSNSVEKHQEAVPVIDTISFAVLYG